jgi:hypothetical protein
MSLVAAGAAASYRERRVKIQHGQQPHPHSPKTKNTRREEKDALRFFIEIFHTSSKSNSYKKKEKKNANFSICHLPSPTFDLFYFLGAVAGFPWVPPVFSRDRFSFSFSLAALFRRACFCFAWGLSGIRHVVRGEEEKDTAAAAARSSRKALQLHAPCTQCGGKAIRWRSILITHNKVIKD